MVKKKAKKRKTVHKNPRAKRVLDEQSMYAAVTLFFEKCTDYVDLLEIMERAREKRRVEMRKDGRRRR